MLSIAKGWEYSLYYIPSRATQLADHVPNPDLLSIETRPQAQE